MDLILAAKERQAQEANKAAAVLLQELEQEQQLIETRRQAKQRQKEKRKAKRKAKKAPATKDSSLLLNDEDDDEEVDEEEELKPKPTMKPRQIRKKITVVEITSSRSSSSRSLSPPGSPERTSKNGQEGCVFSVF